MDASDRDVERIRILAARVGADGWELEDASAACPICLALGIAGVPVEEARRRAPKYFKELDAMQLHGVPDNSPSVLCWDCRGLAHHTT